MFSRTPPFFILRRSSVRCNDIKSDKSGFFDLIDKINIYLGSGVDVDDVDQRNKNNPANPVNPVKKRDVCSIAKLSGQANQVKNISDMIDMIHRIEKKG